MNEFALIKKYFATARVAANQEVIFGIGDDAACVAVPADKQLVISTDTLVAHRHFKENDDPYTIAYKAVMVNLSDMAAMGALPNWITLALTLPTNNSRWLKQFSKGLHDGLSLYGVSLIGGDTTCGPLSITITVGGLVAKNKAIRRSGAKSGDKIIVTGNLGGAALALSLPTKISIKDAKILRNLLEKPKPRLDCNKITQIYATAAIDISDGLSADLNHLCVASKLGAFIDINAIPIHPLLRKYVPDKALELAFTGGDDYQLCFSVAAENEGTVLKAMADKNLTATSIGTLQNKSGIYYKNYQNQLEKMHIKGYSHF